MSIKKILIGLVATSIFGIVVLFIVIPVLSQGPALPPGEYDLEAGQYVFTVPELGDTPVPPDTPIPPTDTPVPSGHNILDWHPVTSSIPHSHGDDPALLDYLFGPAGALYGGQTISYPWQTWSGMDFGDPPQAGLMENDFKHEGYKYFAEGPGVCEMNQPQFDAGKNCLTAWRIQYHAVGGAVGINVRFHSCWFEFEVSTQDLSESGTVKTGMVCDYGILSERETQSHIPLPQDPSPLTQGPNDYPYRHHWPMDAVPLGSQQAVPYTWATDDRYGYSQIVKWFHFQVRDDWQGVDPADPSRVELICPDFQCEQNHSEARLSRFLFNVNGKLDYLDTDSDGFIDFSGFTDRFGNILSESCSPLGIDCIPLEMVHVPVGEARFTEQSRTGDLSSWTEHDLSPPGEFWIEFPN